MCWTTFKTANKLIAEEDIPIFKVCVESITINTVNSYFKYYKYELNIVHRLTDKILTYNVTDSTGAVHTCIDVGYHSYLTSKCILVKDCVGRAEVVYDKGQFLCTYGSYALRVAGYIPKGSEYYVNEQGECVSDSICLTKVEEW